MSGTSLLGCGVCRPEAAWRLQTERYLSYFAKVIADDARTCAFHRSSGCSICVVRFVRLEEWTVINENEHSSYPTEWTNLVYERTLRREAAVTVPGLRYKQSRALFPLLCHVSSQRHVRSRPALTILDCTVQVDALLLIFVSCVTRQAAYWALAVSVIQGLHSPTYCSLRLA